MINCMVIDDEQAAIDILTHYIAQVPGLHLEGTSTNPLEALQTVASGRIDLLFLDIQMPELSGIDFIKAIQGKARVILTTAYSEFALESYDLDVADYLLKPIRFPRFLSAVQKVFKELETPGGMVPEDDYIFVKTESKGKLLKIDLQDIDYIEGMKNYVAIHMGGKKTLVYTSMKELEEKLPASGFMRVHKSFIIPVQRITGIDGNMLRLRNVPEEILIGENYKPQLMELIKGKMLR